MKTEKMSFKNIKDVLTRFEMKQIIAGGIQCNINGNQMTCPLTSLISCAEACARQYGYGCGGCTGF